MTERIIKEISKLSPAEKIRIIQMLKNSIKNDEVKKSSILELEGLGKKIWEEVNIEEYIGKKNFY